MQEKTDELTRSTLLMESRPQTIEQEAWRTYVDINKTTSLITHHSPPLGLVT